MLDTRQLDMIIREGEGLTVEFKEHFTPRISEDMVAFANTRGGLILLGVRDDKSVIGESLTNDLKSKINSIARNCNPPIQVKIKQIGDIIAIEVPQGDEKPYGCASGYFRRLDGTTQKMTNHELRVMFSDYGEEPFEDRINKSSSWEDISKQKIQTFLKEADISLRKIVPQKIMASLNVARVGKITNAGVLFFAKDPRKHIFHSQMTLIAFKGKDRIHIFDRQDIYDDLLTQFNSAVFFLKKHLNRRSEIKGVTRKDIYEIPFEALREAIANAIIHRDYTMRGTSLMVEVYDDRVEIINPGGLPKGLAKKDFGKISVRRNERIADLFFRMDKVELAGTGIRRMREAMALAGLSSPRIRQTNFFTIIFKRLGTVQTWESEGREAGESNSPGVGERLRDFRSPVRGTGQAGIKPELQPESQPESLEIRLLRLLQNETLSKSDLSRHLGQKAVSGHLNKVVHSLLGAGLIEYTLPDKPKSRFQKYRATAAGRKMLKEKSKNRD